MSATEIYVSKFYLVSTKGNVEITKTCTLGRGSKSDIKINDSKLSSTHCSFDIKGVSLKIKDLNSTNGVHVNGERIAPETEVNINYGDKILLGSTTYILRESKQNRDNAPSEIVPERSFNFHNLITFFEAEGSWKWKYLSFTAFGGLVGGMEFLFEDYIIDEGSILLTMMMSILVCYSGAMTHSYLRAFYIKPSGFFSHFSWIGVCIVAFLTVVILSISNTPRHEELRDRLTALQASSEYMENPMLFGLSDRYTKSHQSKIITKKGNLTQLRKEYEKVMGPVLVKATPLCKEKNTHCDLINLINEGLKL